MTAGPCLRLPGPAAGSSPPPAAGPGEPGPAAPRHAWRRTAGARRPGARVRPPAPARPGLPAGRRARTGLP